MVRTVLDWEQNRSRVTPADQHGELLRALESRLSGYVLITSQLPEAYTSHAASATVLNPDMSHACQGADSMQMSLAGMATAATIRVGNRLGAGKATSRLNASWVLASQAESETSCSA